MTGTANAVDAPEALDDPDRIPVDVVVYEVIAVLKVLAFGDAVRGDEESISPSAAGWGFCCATSSAGRNW